MHTFHSENKYRKTHTKLKKLRDIIKLRTCSNEQIKIVFSFKESLMKWNDEMNLFVFMSSGACYNCGHTAEIIICIRRWTKCILMLYNSNLNKMSKWKGRGQPSKMEIKFSCSHFRIACSRMVSQNYKNELNFIAQHCLNFLKWKKKITTICSIAPHKLHPVCNFSLPFHAVTQSVATELYDGKLNNRKRKNTEFCRWLC